MPPVSVCHQLSWIGCSSAPSPQRTASGLRGSPTLATLGLYTRDWMHIDYPDVPSSVGRFEAQSFDPVRWRPEYPNTAFDNMRADDAFWA